MKIFLIRHGQTSSDIENRYGGDYDDNLTEKGRQQSEELAQKLRGEDIQIIYHSPKIRATETAQIINKELKVELKVLNNIRERNHYGILTGLTKAEALVKFPEEVIKLKNLRHDIKSSEDYESFKQRILNTFKNLKGETIAIVTHSGPIKCIARELYNKELPDIADCGFIVIEDDKLIT